MKTFWCLCNALSIKSKSALYDLTPPKVSSLFFFFNFIYLFMRDTERAREVETQAEGEAGSMQGARCGTHARLKPRLQDHALGLRQALNH